MTGADLKDWRVAHMKLKGRDAAEKLGVSMPTYWRMESRKSLPRWVGLACNAISLRLPSEPMKGDRQ